VSTSVFVTSKAFSHLFSLNQCQHPTLQRQFVETKPKSGSEGARQCTGADSRSCTYNTPTHPSESKTSPSLPPASFCRPTPLPTHDLPLQPKIRHHRTSTMATHGSTQSQQSPLGILLNKHPRNDTLPLSMRDPIPLF
jgi:hypothetical protein